MSMLLFKKFGKTVIAVEGACVLAAADALATRPATFRRYCF
jgi:hypothetical protein